MSNYNLNDGGMNFNCDHSLSRGCGCCGALITTVDIVLKPCIRLHFRFSIVVEHMKFVDYFSEQPITLLAGEHNLLGVSALSFLFVWW